MNVFQLHRYFTGIMGFKCISNMYFKYWNNICHQSNNLRFPNDLKINTFSAKTKMSTKLSTMKLTLKREILSH